MNESVGNDGKSYDSAYGVSPWFLGLPRNRPFITVSYPRRFRTGKFVLAAFIPAEKLTVRTIAEINASSYWGDHYEPLVIFDGKNGMTLALTFRLPDVRFRDRQRILRCAKIVATWTRERFEMPTIISPVPGRVKLLSLSQAF